MQNSINDQLTALVDDTNASLARLEGIKADAIGKNHRIADANGRYIEYCKGSFPYHLNLSNLKIVGLIAPMVQAIVLLPEYFKN